MTSRTTMLLAAPLLAVVAACSGSPRMTPPVEPARAEPAQGQDAAILRARADSARLPYTAADIAFMTHMIAHHAQALEMAKLAPTHGASGPVRTLAGRILNGQRDEITTMQQWLRDRQQPVPDPSAGGLPGAGTDQRHGVVGEASRAPVHRDGRTQGHAGQQGVERGGLVLQDVGHQAVPVGPVVVRR